MGRHNKIRIVFEDSVEHLKLKETNLKIEERVKLPKEGGWIQIPR